MRKAIIGAGGFAREIQAAMGLNCKFFVDDEYYQENQDNILPLSQFDENEYEVVVAIGDPKDRSDMIQKLPKNTKYFTYIHPTVITLGNNIEIGEGSIICAGCILTTNIKIGKHAHINLQTTIGHDCRIGDHFTTAPGAKVSGNCKVGDMVYLGTNSSIKEKITVNKLTTIGSNATVVKDIQESGTYVGVPAKKIK